MKCFIILENRKCIFSKNMCVCSQSLSHVQLFHDSMTVAHQDPLSMELPGNNPGVDCHFFLQGIFFI